MTFPSLGRESVLPVVLVALLASTSGLYFFLDPEGSRFLPWLGIYSLQFALYAAIACELHRGRRIPVPAVLAAACLARIVLWFTTPVFEADYYRYLWDGHVLSEGINPYLHPPEDPALDDVETDYRFFIRWSEFRTIYPPLAQYVFLLAHAVAPDSLLGLKAVLTCFDLATGLVLLLWMTDRGLQGGSCALYLLNPLVLKEVANSAHVDAVAVFLATAALYLFAVRRKLGASLLLALSAGAKLYAVALVPILVRFDHRRVRNVLVFAIALALLYLPFVDAGPRLFSGTLAFGRYWLFNASLFRLIDAIAPADFVAKAAAAILFAGFVLYRLRSLADESQTPATSLSVLAALLLLSPVVTAWYVLWLLPLASIERSLPWLAFTYLVGFSYSWFHSPDAAPFFQLVEYGGLFALLAWRGAFARSPFLGEWRRREVGETPQ